MSQMSRPSLLALLTKLSDPSVTTSGQRYAIRSIITDYLNNEISHVKVFAYLGQVLTHSFLAAVISELSEEEQQQPQPPAPKNDSASADTKQAIDDVLLVKKQRPPSPPTANLDEARKLRAYLFRSLVAPLRWIFPHNAQAAPLARGAVAVTVSGGSRVLFLGGLPEESPRPAPPAEAADLPPLPVASSPSSPAAPEESLAVSSSSQYPRHLPAAAAAPAETAATSTFQLVTTLDSNTLQKGVLETFDAPRTAAGHSVHDALFSTGPAVVLYGGCQESDNENVTLFGSVWALDEEGLEWVLLDVSSAELPPPRHSCATMLLRGGCCALGTTATTTNHLVVFGGVGSALWTKPAGRSENSTTNSTVEHTCRKDDLVLLNDLWVFSFQTGQWREFKLERKPTPRCGCQFAPLRGRTGVLYGGETRSASSRLTVQNNSRHLPLPPYTSTVASGTWFLSWDVKSVDADGGRGVRQEFVEPQWIRSTSVGPPRAWYAAVSLAACVLPGARGDAVICGNEERLQQWTAHQAILLLSGVTDDAERNLKECPGALIGLVSPASGPEITWRSVPLIGLLDGQSNAPPFRGRLSPAVALLEPPALSLQQQRRREHLQRYGLGGKRKSTDEQEEPRQDPRQEPPQQQLPAEISKAPCLLVAGGYGLEGGSAARQDLWLLRLSQLNPVILSSPHARLRVAEHRLLMGMILSGAATTPELAQFLEQTPGGVANYASLAAKSQELRVLSSAWHHPAEDVEPEIFQCSSVANAGLIWALATMVHHPLSCIAHLVDNAMEHGRASSIHVAFERWREQDCLTVTDDGCGLEHPKLHRLLRSFGHQSPAMLSEEGERHHMGVGFKISLGRLAYNVLVLSSSSDGVISAGFLSLPFNRSFQSESLIAPVCCWGASDGLPVCSPEEEAAFGMSLSTILNNTPLGTADELEAELAKFKNHTGTRVIFFGLRADVPCISATGKLQRRPSHAGPPTYEDATISMESWLPAARVTAEGDLALEALSASTNPRRPPGFEVQIGTLPPFDWPVNLAGPTQLPPQFPLWTNAEHSLDFNLMTYMFWSTLHSKATLSFNGVSLEVTNLSPPEDETPAAIDLDLPANDPYAGSLWRFLHRRLKHKLEMPFLFQPKFGDAHFYGLVGVLGPEVCEAGVLLYYRGRLINRAMLPFPMPEGLHQPVATLNSGEEQLDERVDVFTCRRFTAVINVPDFLMPRATKEGFAQDGEVRFQHFYDLLEKELRRWIRVHNDVGGLSALQRRYIEEFDEFRAETWRGQRKVKKIDQFSRRM